MTSPCTSAGPCDRQRDPEGSPDKGTRRIEERDKRRELRKVIGRAACVCWDYETPDANCTCGAY